MISRIAARLTNFLYNQEIIPDEDRELYQYGFFLLLSKAMFLIVTMLVGLAANVFWESLLFYALFSSLRGYAGGVHASNEFTCDFISGGTFAASVVCIRIIENLNCSPIAILFIIWGSLVILNLSPMDTNEKPLSKNEQKHYRKICSAIIILYISFGVLFTVLRIFKYLYVISTCIVLEAILLLIGKAKTTLTKR